jgi:hypothetical protein
MDEQTKTEQDLSEEQLQQITGGSGNQGNMEKAMKYQTISRSHLALYKIATEAGFPTYAAQHLNVSLDAANKAQAFLKRSSEDEHRYLIDVVGPTRKDYQRTERQRQ